jgi:hypothetical protein
MNTMTPDLRTFVDRVIVPALVDRFLREQAAASAGAPAPIRPAA